MPIAVNSSEMLSSITRGEHSEGLRRHIQFEKTAQIQGVCRVMVRTHLNRQGVGSLTNRSSNKTLSPPVLNIFQDDFDPKKYTVWSNLIESWLIEAKKNLTLRNQAFKPEDIDALEELHSHNYEYVSNSDNEMPNVKSWRKISTGVYTGIRHLSSKYALNPEAINNAPREAAQNGLNGINRLIYETSSAIDQFGIPLASSFWADLGSPGSEKFVKADVHVTDSVKCFYGDLCPGGAELLQFSFDKVCESSSELASARAVDKLLYFCGSTKLYFLEGIPTNKEFSAGSRKDEFLALLGILGKKAGYKNTGNRNASQSSKSKVKVLDEFSKKCREYESQIQNKFTRSGFMSEINKLLKNRVSKEKIIKALEKHPPESYQTTRGIFW